MVPEPAVLSDGKRCLLKAIWFDRSRSSARSCFTTAFDPPKPFVAEGTNFVQTGTAKATKMLQYPKLCEYMPVMVYLAFHLRGGYAETRDSDVPPLHKRFAEECSISEKDVNVPFAGDAKPPYDSYEDNVSGIQDNVIKKGDTDFDVIIGHIEDMLIDENFHKLQLSFLEKYWGEFIDNEENRHEYMNIFVEYTNEIEAFITRYLKKLVPHFEMETFIMELEKRKDNLEGQVFEVLFTLTDFSLFKEMFLCYRMMKEGNIIDVGQSLQVSSIQ